MISSEELSSPSRTEMHFDPVTTYTALTKRVSPGGSARGLCSPSPAGREREGGNGMCEGEGCERRGERKQMCERKRRDECERGEGRGERYDLSKDIDRGES